MAIFGNKEHAEKEAVYGYRGFMLDTGRYFFPPEDVALLIDIAALAGMNVFHWHISDDQGWRFQSDAYPELTAKGSRRAATNFSPVAHGGFYTKEDIRGIVAHAAERGVTVIPELDIPGHTQSALAAYPELGCFGRKLPVARHWGVKHDILCGGKPAAAEFVNKILDEYIELFPGGVIHLGGDEAVKTRWRLCPDCQSKMAENGLKDEDELQTLFVNAAAAHLKTRGYAAMVWNNEHIDDRLDKDVIIQYYFTDGKELAAAANRGRRFVNSFSDAYYLDLPPAVTPLSKATGYDPELPGLDDEGRKNLLGTEACLWSEYVPDVKRAVRLMLPRVIAVAHAGLYGRASADGVAAAYERIGELIAPELERRGITLPEASYYEPSAAAALPGRTGWALRPLHWHGLHNLIDNAAVAAKYGRKRD